MLALPAYTAHVGHLSTLQMETLDECYTPREEQMALTRNVSEGAAGKGGGKASRAAQHIGRLRD
jgi:hypothetical protein